MKYILDYRNMHIHPSSPNSSISEEDAATKIQAGFRGYRVRKQLKENVNNGPSNNQLNIQTNRASVKRNGELKEQNGVVSVPLVQEKNIDEEKCATKIQASVRGFLVRKKQKIEANAATKIQAGFRGFRTRKQLKKLKN